ncbi:MAG: winged helix DNA-binding domain-containing protein, partial [Proteobacteria bacterium]|nr:winged helix DNA-binding domain-containing protein [Pseudomonadota bacterium]
MPQPAPLEISAAEGRRLVLYLNGLTPAPTGRLSGAGLLALIARLGFVQLDSVRVVERAHHMSLFARHPRYRPAGLR